MKQFALVLTLIFGLLTPIIPANANELLVAAMDHQGTYSRSSFKHWIDEDGDGCNTRAEVLIAEAIVKPKIGPKCKLTGGKWISTYDGKTITNASLLDVDHMVPLAEAWRSGAWRWSAAQRQAYANNLGDSRALNAVTLTTNRSKSDRDPALWMPTIDKCVYIMNWVVLKWRYSLTYDAIELAAVERISQECFGDASFEGIRGGPKVIEDPLNSNKPTLPVIPAPVVSYVEIGGITANMQVLIDVNIPEITGFDALRMLLSLVNLKDVNGRPTRLSCLFDQNRRLLEYDRYIPYVPISLRCELPAGQAAEYQLQLIPRNGFVSNFSNYQVVSQVVPFKVEVTSSGPSATPLPSQGVITPVSPGAFCSPAGAVSKSVSGVLYTCKTSPTDIRNRWRQ